MKTDREEEKEEEEEGEEEEEEEETVRKERNVKWMSYKVCGFFGISKQKFFFFKEKKKTPKNMTVFPSFSLSLLFT